MATPVATGMAMEEYRAIKRHYTTLVDTLGKTVDPARFASRLEEKSLIGNGEIHDHEEFTGMR